MKMQSSRGALLKKMFLEISQNSQGLWQGVFLWILRTFYEHFFYRTPVAAASVHVMEKLDNFRDSRGHRFL